MDAEPESNLEAARRYARLGWSVIPIQPRGKRPLVPWLEFQEHAATGERIDAWFGHRPDANVGIVTGRISRLVVIDIDPARGGEASRDAIAGVHEPLPPGPEVLTGGGGRHLYFRHPGGVIPNRVDLYPGIDVRGDGGCVVAPPSVHPSGRRYRWLAGAEPDQRALPPLPDWAARRFAEEHRRGRSLPEWRGLVRAGVEQGRRNATLASLSGHLLWHGVDPDVVLELLLAWNRARCRPPLPDEEVAQVVASIAGRHAE